MSNRLFSNNPTFPDTSHGRTIPTLTDISLKQGMANCPDQILRIFLKEVCSCLIDMSNLLAGINGNDRGCNTVEYPLNLLTGAS